MSEPFLNPVDKKVPGYYELIKYPMGKLKIMLFMKIVKYIKLYKSDSLYEWYIKWKKKYCYITERVAF